MDVDGKTVVLTGAFEQRRAELVAGLESLGAKVGSKVSKRTDVLFAGAKSGNKLAKARKLGVEIHDEQALMALLGAATGSEAPVSERLAILEGKTVCTTGRFRTFDQAPLERLLRRSGAKLEAAPSDETDIMVSGLWPGSEVRDAIAKGADIWTEGQLRLALEGRSVNEDPGDDMAPNGARLSQLPVIEEGELHLSSYPGPALVLNWRKVAFKPHLRFCEVYGDIYCTDFQYLGKLLVDGVELAAETDPNLCFYGIETFRRNRFYEDGRESDADDLRYDGQHGFNATPLVMNPTEAPKAEWKTTGQFGPDGEIMELTTPSACHGDLAWDDECNFWLMVDRKRMTCATIMHTAPYVIDPEDPYRSS